MTLAAPRHPIRLERHACLHLAAPLELSARRGTLWITRDGDPQDVVLEAGQTHRFDGRDALLVYALADAAELEAQPLAPPPRPGLGIRLARWWAATAATPAFGARR